MNFWIGKHNFNFIIHLLDQLQLRFITELNTHFVQKFWLVCLSNKLFSKQIKNELYNYDEISNCASREKWNAWGSQRCVVVGERKKQNCEILQKNKILAGFRKTTLLRLAELSIRFCFEFFSSNNGKTFFLSKFYNQAEIISRHFSPVFRFFTFREKKCNFLNRLCGVKLLFPVLNLATRGNVIYRKTQNGC